MQKKAAFEDCQNRMLHPAEDVLDEPIESDEYVPIYPLFCKGHYPKVTNEESYMNARGGMNNSILDQGLGIFRRKPENKRDWKDSLFLAVPPQNTGRNSLSCRQAS